MSTKRVTRPVNTSGRTVKQIVEEAEATYLLPVLIGEVVHGAECRCMVCFHKYADQVIRTGEEALNAAQADTAGDAAGYLVPCDAGTDPA